MSNMPPPAPPSPPGFSNPAAASGNAQNGVGTAALVLGIISIITGFFFIGLLFGIIGLILGIVGRKRAKRGEASNGGVALAGIITSITGSLIAIAAIVITFFVLANSDIGSLVECVADADGDPVKEDQCEVEFEDNLGG